MSSSLPLTAYPDLASRVEALERDGYVYLPGVLSPSEIATLRESIERQEARPEYHDWHNTVEEHGSLDKSVNNGFKQDPDYLQYLDHEHVIDVAEAVHGPDCHIITITGWMTGPGRKDQPIHADWVPIELPEDVLKDHRVKVPMFITTAHFYLDDLYEELGPTQFIPGSHMAGRRPDGETEWNGIKPQSVLCKAGDVVIFRSEIWHRGTANNSDQTRYLLQVHYASRWISQRFPPYLGKFQIDPDVLAQATPRQRRLLGEHVPGPYA